MIKSHMNHSTLEIHLNLLNGDLSGSRELNDQILLNLKHTLIQFFA
jgi:hypothetical protein